MNGKEVGAGAKAEVFVPTEGWPEFLRVLRARRRWNQAQLAEQIFASRTSVAWWEQGRSVPRRVYHARLRELAAAGNGK